MENPTYPAQIAQAYARMAELPPDPWRPAYHLSPLSGTLADPDGLCQVGGTYHIFYVTNPLGCLTTQRTSCVWGHYSTRDFVHYRRETTAIFPTPPATGTASTAARPWWTGTSSIFTTPATSATTAASITSTPAGSRTSCGWRVPTASTLPIRPCC